MREIASLYELTHSNISVILRGKRDLKTRKLVKKPFIYKAREELKVYTKDHNSFKEFIKKYATR
jgi:hypothetical protein